MTSQLHRQSSSGDVTERNKEFTSVMDASQAGGTFYDNSLRPKSFLRDEVDEFNRVLAELLESRQRPTPLASENDIAYCSSQSEYDKVDVFQTTRQDCRRTNVCFVNSDFDIENVPDARDTSPPHVTRWTAELMDYGDGDDDAEVADGYDTVLKIVEEEDRHLVPKSGNIRSLRDVCTNDLFTEVCLSAQ